MRAATLLPLSVKFDAGLVFIDGKPVDCTEHEITIPTSSVLVTVWLQKAAETDGTFRAVLCHPDRQSSVFILTPGAVAILTRGSRLTVVGWMCNAAGITL